MDVFLIGLAIGFAGAVLIFVFLNLEIPDKLDTLEGEVREKTEGYRAKKTSLGAWIKSKFRRG